MITLLAHIEVKHQGNIAGFARSVNKGRQQVYDWIAADAHWCNGTVWIPVKL